VSILITDRPRIFPACCSSRYILIVAVDGGQTPEVGGGT